MDDPEAFEEPVETAASRVHRTVEVAVVTLADEEGAERALPLERAWTLGSAPQADVRVAHPTTSRLHARIEARDGAPWVVDLGSTNGTFVDGVRVEAALLRDGSRVRLGEAVRRVRLAADGAKGALWPTDRFGPLLGRSARMRALFEHLQKVADSEATVLVQGETGTGKDVVARAIHEASPRAQGPFVVFDCAAVPEALFESELFGHVRGAFTGAERSREGAAQAADGGVLFLDEVGELPVSVQPKLLRMLETRSARRVGESRHAPLDVRVIAATHRDLAKMVGQGAFREDLYFRLVVLPVEVPPLRERRDDVPMLIEHFAGRSVDEALVREAQTRMWPGNVRELRTFVERAIALGPDAALRLAETARPPRSAGGHDDVDLEQPLRRLKDAAADRVERAYLEGWLHRTGRNVTAMAQAIGLDRTYVHRLLRKHGL